jgi:hypothetical protein
VRYNACFGHAVRYNACFGHAVRYNECFQASAAVQMRSAFFWNFSQRRFLACRQRFVTTYQPHFKGSSSRSVVPKLP